MNITYERWEAWAERAKACNRWEWMAGMLLLGSRTVPLAAQRLVSPYPRNYATSDKSPGGMWTLCSTHCVDYAQFELDDWLADFRDAGTVGCLLARVKVAWNAEAVFTSAASLCGGVCVQRPDGRVVQFLRDHLVEGLIEALEAAP